MRGILIFMGLILTTGTAIADRPVTQEESERLRAALKEQGCSGEKMEFDDGKFETMPRVPMARYLLVGTSRPIPS